MASLKDLIDPKIKDLIYQKHQLLWKQNEFWDDTKISLKEKKRYKIINKKNSICDALLGAVNLGDIGTHFPDNDIEYKGIDSKILLKRVVKLIRSKEFEISKKKIDKKSIDQDINKITIIHIRRCRRRG